MGSLEDIRNKFIVDKEKSKVIKEDIKHEQNMIEISKLVSFRKGQPFGLYDENKKEEMKESIKENGILVPIIARKIEIDKYEIISGHNRVQCSKELGLSTIPAQIVECNDDKATLIMLETNLCNREQILPVEKGYAYKMKLEILKKTSNSSNINENNENSPMEKNDSQAQMYRYIRLTELIKELQKKVNEEIIPVRAGVEISYLNKQEQEIINSVLDDEQLKLTLVQAQKIRMKKNQITYEIILKILKNEKVKIEKFTGKIEKRAFKIYKDKFKNDKEFTDLIIDLLDKYFSSDSE